MASISDLLGDAKINSGATRRLVHELRGTGRDPAEAVHAEGLEQISDEEMHAELPRAADDYQRGKAAALQSLVGRVMKKTTGRGNPARLQEIFKELLS